MFELIVLLSYMLLGYIEFMTSGTLAFKPSMSKRIIYAIFWPYVYTKQKMMIYNINKEMNA